MDRGHIPTGPRVNHRRDTREPDSRNGDPYRDSRRGGDPYRDDRRSDRYRDNAKPYRDERGYNQRSSYGGGQRDRETRGGYLPPRNPRAMNDRDRRQSPAPDYSDVVSLDKLERPSASKWDRTPKGFEEVHAERAKALGMFYKFGSKRMHVDYRRALSLLEGDDSSSGVNGAPNAIESTKLSANSARYSRTILVKTTDNLSTDSVDQLVQFINNFIITLDTEDNEGKDKVILNNRLVEPENTVVLELLNEAVTTIALALNGEVISSVSDSPLSIRRPGNYIAKTGADKGYTVVNLPKDKSISEVKSFIESNLGSELTEFQLLQNQLTQESTGIAFIKSESDSTSSKLNGLEFEQNVLKCFKSSDAKESSIHDRNFNAHNLADGVAAKVAPEVKPTRVVAFLNCLSAKTFASDAAYESSKKDFWQQCSTFGTVDKIEIPKPAEANSKSVLPNANGVGKVYVKFSTVEAAQKAYENLAGYKYGDRTVLTSYFDELDFSLQLW